MKRLLLASAILALTACGAETITDARVTGSVHFAPVPGSFDGLILEVQLEDTSLADGPAISLASQEFTGISSVPVSFALPYSVAAIDERDTYTVSASVYSIADGERHLQYVSTQSYPVITGGWPDETQVTVEGIGD